MTTFLARDTTDRVMEALSVSEGVGDLLYFSAPGVLAVGGGDVLTPLPALYSSLVGIPPGGSPSNDGDLATQDSGMAIDLVMQDSYAGGVKKIVDELASVGGDLSGGVLTPAVNQVDCPNSETWPDANSKVAFAVNELGDILYINVQYSDGTQKSTELLLSSGL